MNRQDLSDIINAYLGDGSLFLVDVKITPQNKVMVFIDGDAGVTIEDCSRLSRHIESLFDRDLVDFELQVSSVGVGHPLKLRRQFQNNVGRRLAVKNNEESVIKGKLDEVNDEGVYLQKDKPRKGKKKKKEPDTDEDTKVFLSFHDISEARVQVSFK